MSLAIGDQAPEFDLPTDQGSNVSNVSLAGKSYVLYFYPKDDTPGCTKEAIAFSTAIAEYEKSGVTIIGVSKDPIKAHAKFRKKYDLKVVLASDENQQTCEKFGVWVEKNMYGKTYMGIERSTFLVDGQGVIQKIWRKVSVDGHNDEVLAACALN